MSYDIKSKSDETWKRVIGIVITILIGSCGLSYLVSGYHQYSIIKDSGFSYFDIYLSMSSAFVGIIISGICLLALLMGLTYKLNNDTKNRQIIVVGVTFWISFFIVFIGYSLSSNAEKINNLVLKDVNKIYSEVLSRNQLFGDSIPGKALKNAIIQNDFEKMKELTANSDNLFSIPKDQMFEKLIIVKSIANDKITADFNSIYSDNYITYKEYKEFKERSIVELTKSLSDSGKMVADKTQMNLLLISKF